MPAKTTEPPELNKAAKGSTAPALPLKVVNPHDHPPATDQITIKNISRPCYGVYDDFVRFADNPTPEPHRAGLYWHGANRAGDPIDQRIGAPLHIEALSHDEHSGNFGRLLRFRDSTGQWKEWLMPMAMLAGNGEALRSELLSRGYTYNDRHKAHILSHIMQSQPRERLIAAIRTGWHGDGTAFVLPQTTLGDTRYRFQAEHAHDSHLSTRGTLDAWRSQIGERCSGSPILILAACTGFAGALLKPAKQQAAGGAGLNLLGKSSRGKTTALQVAASIWGSPETVRNWSATGNGLEALAASLNDTLLPLDELSQSSPYDAGNMVYLLANGTGKQRAKRTGGMRTAARWRLMVLSSGERTLAAHMAEGGKRAKAGQEARLLDVPAVDRPYGAFDQLHGLPDGASFSNTLKQATSEQYGLTGQAFVRQLMEYKGDLPHEYSEICRLPAFQVSDGVESRAAGTFALLALGGELATGFGLTGWREGEAIEASVTGFNLWREHRGQGNTEDRQILEAIADFIDRHGDSRFSDLDQPASAGPLIRDRAGYWRNTAEGRTYYLTSGGLKEAGAGHELKAVIATLDAAGWITERSTGKNSIKVKVHGKATNLYAIQPQEAGQ